MTIPVTELRQGVTFKDQGKILLVLQYEHQKKARGNATIKVKVKNLRDGSITDRTYLSGQKVDQIAIIKAKAQFLYQDDQGFHFMDKDNYEQFFLGDRVIKDEARFLKEGMEVELQRWQEEILGISLPIKVCYQVRDSSPGVKGNSATNVFKEVVVENGLKVKVPLFIDRGDEIIVDTRTGNYVGRGVIGQKDKSSVGRARLQER